MLRHVAGRGSFVGNTFTAQPAGTERGVPTFDAQRLDVAVHLLALHQLSNGGLDRGDGLFAAGPSPDWAAHSLNFSKVDGEPAVAERLRSVVEDNSELVVGCSQDGSLVTGAVDAAVSMYLEEPAFRTVSSSGSSSSSGRVDRSVGALRDAGWSRSDLRNLLHLWALTDHGSAVIVLKAGHSRFNEVYGELDRLFVVIHTEVDFISSVDRRQLATHGHGSAQIVLVSGSPTAIEKALSSAGDLDGEVVLAAFVGEDAAHALSTLWDPVRPVVPNPEHRRRVRRLQLKSVTDQAVGLVRKRVFN